MSSDDIAMILLNKEEQDAISEISMVSMGAAASTLSLLVGQEVDVAPVEVQEYASLADFAEPFPEAGKLLLTVPYVKGLVGTTVYVLRIADARRLSDAMMGPSGEAPEDPLSELQLGATNELMSQMMNASATGLASLLHEAVEVANPTLTPFSMEALPELLPALGTEPFIANKLQWLITGDSPIELIEIRSVAETKVQVEAIVSRSAAIEAADDEEEAKVEDVRMNYSSAGSGASPPPSPQYASSGHSDEAARQVDPVTVRPAHFSSFDQYPHASGGENKNLDLVMDVTLNLSVELGRTELSIKEVLELTRGSVIELERVAGEPVDLMANGKLIAKGEVVVIEDNFGLRITSIISPAERLRGL